MVMHPIDSEAFLVVSQTPACENLSVERRLKPPPPPQDPLSLVRVGHLAFLLTLRRPS